MAACRGAWLFAIVSAVWSGVAASAGEPVGKLVSVTGQVSAVADGKPQRALGVGDQVLEGDTLVSEAGASAKFLMNDQTILDLNPSTRLLVEHYQRKDLGNRNVAIQVVDGTVRASVNQHLGRAGKFIIRTRTATMGVRGTEFVVQSDQKSGQSQLTVLKGLVQAGSSAPGAAMLGVPSGSRLTVDSLGSPQLARLSPEQLAAVAKSAIVRDSTFRSAVEIRRSSPQRSGGSPAASALSAARAAATRAPASQAAESSASVVTASIPGVTDGLHNLRSQTALMQVQNVRLNIVFTP